jgi:hypothetical protein
MENMMPFFFKTVQNSYRTAEPRSKYNVTPKSQRSELLGFSLCPSSGILNTIKLNVSETGFVFVLR